MSHCIFYPVAGLLCTVLRVTGVVAPEPAPSCMCFCAYQASERSFVCVFLTTGAGAACQAWVGAWALFTFSRGVAHRPNKLEVA
ncbi:hypothetical protein COO60DRAFT_522649 [Scenedesmus sp. NREL 46B-D3]|nr:hypothetical protein COO60DRAFT_522649 [Scenedesmus sp. NREL 46B-D3]